VPLRVEQRRLAAGGGGGERVGAVVEEEGRDGRVFVVAGDDEGRPAAVAGLAGVHAGAGEEQRGHARVAGLGGRV